MRCDRTFTGKAGRVVGGRPVCPSCAPNFRGAVLCPACDRLTRRLGRMAGREAMVCEACRRRDTHATCRVCGRHRRVGHNDEGGRAVCVACSGGIAPVHACPDCGGTTPGTGSAPCRGCSLDRRIDRRIALNVELLEQPWVRTLFREFCAWEGLPRTAGNMTRRIDAYAECFAIIDRHCTFPATLGQELLLRLLGPEELRRQHLVLRFLAGRIELKWDPRRAETYTEVRRTEAVLAGAGEQSWGPALRAYHDHLARDRTLQPKTIRSYINAGAGLLAYAGHANPAMLQQAEVDRYLRRQPGQRASLVRFLTYVAPADRRQLTMPRQRRAANPKVREEALLRDVRHLLDRIDASQSIGEGRAILAAVISKLYHLPISTVLAVKANDVADNGAVVTLWPGSISLRLFSPLADTFRRWASWQGGYLFPGRSGVQPLSRDAVRHHLTKCVERRGKAEGCKRQVSSH